ncbi:putative membrane protein [Ekhidna lutea]|uniref:Putative membrane protein n=1 Tax=Ekhidna lutea TaxID=447679 RepID=A0A239J9P5_EKHLU|nr:bestrophin family ion channel [Ekhidna lutea]SNT02218.1 putative membrane protein [Ekhidna lutea]
MLIKYSDNPFKQVLGIAFYNKRNIFLFTTFSLIATLQYQFAEIFIFNPITLPVVPVTILGGALAIFLGFRNNSAYDRWWEARKIWGGIVNASRTFGVMICTFSSSYFSKGKVSDERVLTWRKELINRHIGWLYSLIKHLRKHNHWNDLEKYLSEEEIEQIKSVHNKPTQLLHKQSERLQEAYEANIIEDFRHMELANVIKEFYSLQGMAERIKGTIFPYYYNYFTGVFLWLFVICLPFSLAPEMGWGSIPMSIAISFVFTILEKSGAVTEDPFEGRAADTPISTITRNIEIDLLEMIKSETVPAPIEPKIGKFGVKYLD